MHYDSFTDDGYGQSLVIYPAQQLLPHHAPIPISWIKLFGKVCLCNRRIWQKLSSSKSAQRHMPNRDLSICISLTERLHLKILQGLLIIMLQYEKVTCDFQKSLFIDSASPLYFIYFSLLLARKWNLYLFKSSSASVC